MISVLIWILLNTLVWLIYSATLDQTPESVRLTHDETGHIRIYSFQTGKNCSYLVRMNSKHFRLADIFFTDPEDGAIVFSYDLPQGNIHVSVQEIACSTEPNPQNFPADTIYSQFTNLSRSHIEKKFPCTLKFVFSGHFQVQKERVKRKDFGIQRSCTLQKQNLKVLIVGDSITEQILPFLTFKCKKLSYLSFKSYYPENSDCVFFEQVPAIRVGLKLLLHYGNLHSTIPRYDIVIINAGVHDLAPLHVHRMELWIKKKFEFSGSPIDPYYQLGFGKLPFHEKPHPIQDYFQNLNSLLDILTKIGPSVKYFFISTPFGRWQNPRKRERYECRNHPQRIDLIQIMNHYTSELVGSQHFLDMKQLSLTASSAEDNLFRDELHAKIDVKKSVKRIRSKAIKIERKICEMFVEQ